MAIGYYAVPRVQFTDSETGETYFAPKYTDNDSIERWETHLTVDYDGQTWFVLKVQAPQSFLDQAESQSDVFIFDPPALFSALDDAFNATNGTTISIPPDVWMALFRNVD